MAGPQVLRGSLYLLNPDDEGKVRPIVIVSRDTLNDSHSVLAVPFYSQQLEKRKSQPWCAFFSAGEGGLDKDCVAKGDEVTLLDKLDINLSKGPIGKFKPPQMQRITDVIKYAIRADE